MAPYIAAPVPVPAPAPVPTLSLQQISDIVEDTVQQYLLETVPIERVYWEILERIVSLDVIRRSPPADDEPDDPRFKCHFCILLMVIVKGIDPEHLVENFRRLDEATMEAGPAPEEYEALFEHLDDLGHPNMRTVLADVRQASTAAISRTRLRMQHAAGTITATTLDIEMTRAMLVADGLQTAIAQYLD